jgi:hypothetical protein
MSTFWHPFPRSRWQRLMTRDARRSVQERYGSAEEYVQRYRATADDLVRAGYLLDEDARAMVATVEPKVKELFPQPATAAR